MVALAAVLLLAAIPGAAEPDGAAVYSQHCAACHGAQAWGGADGPSLRRVGPAALDFYLTTGRMPAAAPWIQIEHRDQRAGQQLDPAEIDAVEAYLAPVVAGGPLIPRVVANGDVEHGRALYALNCEQCHNAHARGGSLGTTVWAPALDRATILQVAEAIRVGPGEMPQFGDAQVTQRDLDDVASYVMSMQLPPSDVPPLRSTGPVPEGAVGYLAVIALVAFVFTFWRVDTPAREREEAVRRDEGEHSE
jgi:ubiquinol-cytochrome c reductase cytochrome c subunit